MQEEFPVLISCKPLEHTFQHLQKIYITSDIFTLGRSVNNKVVIPFISISRNHCIISKINDSDWVIEDYSSMGLEINKHNVGKGIKKKLSHGDIIKLEPTGQFVYKFVNDHNEALESPRKRIKLDIDVSNSIVNNVKMKFEQSQNYEIKHIEEKIQNTKQMQTMSIQLKHKLQSDMKRRMQKLKNEFAAQIENLKGEKNEVEMQKALLLEARDTHIATLKQEMEGKIAELMEQIQKHNESETELLKENNLLKEKLLKEREEFLAELNRENSSKQDMLEKLESKMREQEEIRLKEKKELEERLRKETEQLRIAKEKELELTEQRRKKEKELEQQLNDIRTHLKEQIEQTEQERNKAEHILNEQMDQMKKLSDVEKVKMDQLIQDREEMQRKLNEAQLNAQKSLEELRKQVKDREIELAALAADRIQRQADQSSEVINTLQNQLESVKNQLQSVETEKKTLLESLCLAEPGGEGSSKQSTLAEVGELMESELQCSICSELFVVPIVLNCSHTYCKYCITVWKKKKNDCPICRAKITSETKNLVLETFIDKMVQNLTEDMKKKRHELLKNREAEVAVMMNRTKTVTRTTSRRTGRGNTRNTTTTRQVTTAHFIGAATTIPGPTRIPTVDLTMIPMTRNSLPPLPLQQPQDLVVIPVTFNRPNSQTMMVVSGGDPYGSPEYPALTTVGSDAATPAALVDIGHQAAPSDSVTHHTADTML